MMVSRVSWPLFAFGCMVFVSASALAAAPQSLGKYGYWSTYKMTEGNAPVCYMSITAKPPEGKVDPKKKKAPKRGDVVLMITHRPSEGATDVISYAAGLKFRAASDVTFKMGDNSFSLFTQGDTAWARDPSTDKAVVAALRNAASVTVLGAAANETPIADTVSLKGIADAYYVIGKACGLAVDKPKAEKKESTVNKPAVKTPTAPTKPQSTKK